LFWGQGVYKKQPNSGAGGRWPTEASTIAISLCPKIFIFQALDSLKYKTWGCPGQAGQIIFN
jgi:hypothetical protein